MPRTKRTWPIKGRGLGLIVGGWPKLVEKIENGFRPEVDFPFSNCVSLKDDLGKTFYKSTEDAEVVELLKEFGLWTR